VGASFNSPYLQSPTPQALLLALGTLQPLAVQMLAGQGQKLSAVRDGVAAMRIEADEGLAALGAQLRSAADLATERHGDIAQGQAELVALLRSMAIGPPAELVAELRREAAAAREGKLHAEERMLQAVLEASLALAAAEPGGAGASSSAAAAGPSDTESRLLQGLRCPISLETMTDPVILVESGHTFERAEIAAWLARNDTCPLSKQRLATKELKPNHALRGQLSDLGLSLAPLPAAGVTAPVAPAPPAPVLLPAARMEQLWGGVSAPDSEEVRLLVSGGTRRGALRGTRRGDAPPPAVYHGRAAAACLLRRRASIYAISLCYCQPGWSRHVGCPLPTTCFSPPR
jgi:hypothetical protein